MKISSRKYLTIRFILSETHHHRTSLEFPEIYRTGVASIIPCHAIVWNLRFRILLYTISVLISYSGTYRHTSPGSIRDHWTHRIDTLQSITTYPRHSIGHVSATRLTLGYSILGLSRAINRWTPDLTTTLICYPRDNVTVVCHRGHRAWRDMWTVIRTYKRCGGRSRWFQDVYAHCFATIINSH